MQLFLKDEIIKDNRISAKALSVYVALIKLFIQDMDVQYITAKQIVFSLTGQLEYDRYFIDDVVFGLEELINNNIISEVKKLSKSERLVDLSSLYFKTDKAFFTMIDDENVFRIMKCKANKFNLLRYYLCLLSTTIKQDGINRFNNSEIKKNIGYMPQQFLIDEFKMPQKTLYNYNIILQAEKIMFFYKPTSYKYVDEKFSSFSGTYGEYKYKDKIIECGQKIENESPSYKIDKKTSTSNRSLANKFRYIRDENKIYDYPTMKAVYEAMVKRNQALHKTYCTDDAYDEHKKDLTVFKEYDFCVEK